MQSKIMTTALSALALGALTMSNAQATTACLITKTESNPFFVKMREGAKAKADELGIELKTYSGKFDTDFESQIAAIETCVANGAGGILITPSIPVSGAWKARLARM